MLNKKFYTLNNLHENNSINVYVHLVLQCEKIFQFGASKATEEKNNMKMEFVLHLFEYLN